MPWWLKASFRLAPHEVSLVAHKDVKGFHPIKMKPGALLENTVSQGNMSLS